MEEDILSKFEQETDITPEEMGKRPPYRFGEKLRAVREQKNLTLKAVAREAGVSESLVSQIERNLVSPAIDTLLALADVLDIDLEYLFAEYKRIHPVHIATKGNRPVREEGDIVYEEVARPDPHDITHTSVESYIIHIPPQKHTSRGSFGHVGREFGFVIQGTGILRYENREYWLRKGDSVSFPASSPHSILNVGEDEFQAVWVVSPAQRFTE